MEILVKVENVASSRRLICDLCGEPLISRDAEDGELYSFYAQFWRDSFSRQLYLEKFLCGNCLRLFKKAKKYDFQTAPEELRQAIISQLERDDYGYIATFDSLDEAFMLINNPFLLPFYGKKIK